MGRIFEGWHLIIILLIILVLFGRGKISEFMGDFAKGIKSFKKGLADDDEQKPAAPRSGEASAEAGSERRTEDKARHAENEKH